MNKLLLIVVLALVNFIASSVAAGRDQLYFSGQVTGYTCEVSIDDGGPIASIELPTLPIGNLTAAGQTSGHKKFDIKLKGSRCVNGLWATVGFYGSSSDDGNLNNIYLGDGAVPKATNVELALYYERSGERIDLGRNLTIDRELGPIKGNAITLTYAVRYFATGTTTAGKVKGKVNYYIVYQ